MGLTDIFRISKIKEENLRLTETNNQLNQRIIDLGVIEYEQAKAKVDELNKQVSSCQETISKLQAEITTLQDLDQKLTKSVSSQEKKLARCKELYKSAEYAINNFLELDVAYSNCKLNRLDCDDLEHLSPSVILKLHCMDVKSLSKAYRDNEKLISNLLNQYASRYTTKANKTIYNLMVIALRAEIQNILYNLKYEKLDKSIEDVKSVTAKYLKLAAEGNQSIAGTLTKFIGEIEYLFINAVKIEYNYYVKKEQARQER